MITEIQEGTVPFLAIKDVPNSRLIIEKNISQKLAANNIKNVGDLLGPHTEASLAGMERLIQAALDNGYQYQLMLDEDPFSVNILCYRTSIPPLVDEVYYTGQVNTSQSLTNIPLYIEIGSELNKDLCSKLHQSLPEYFIPSELHCLEHLPLTANGKTDRKFLSLQEDRLMARDTFYAEPVNEVDKVLATIWQELLGLERVGIHDNFFELGGDSITTIQVVSRLRRLGYQLQPRDLFINQTIARLSEIINSRKENVTHGEQGILHGESGLLPIQQWFLQTDPVDVSYFNQAVLLSISKSVTTEMLQVVYI